MRIFNKTRSLASKILAYYIFNEPFFFSIFCRRDFFCWKFERFCTHIEVEDSMDNVDDDMAKFITFVDYVKDKITDVDTVVDEVNV